MIYRLFILQWIFATILLTFYYLESWYASVNFTWDINFREQIFLIKFHMYTRHVAANFIFETISKTIPHLDFALSAYSYDFMG